MTTTEIAISQPIAISAITITSLHCGQKITLSVAPYSPSHSSTPRPTDCSPQASPGRRTRRNSIRARRSAHARCRAYFERAPVNSSPLPPGLASPRTGSNAAELSHRHPLVSAIGHQALHEDLNRASCTATIANPNGIRGTPKPDLRRDRV
jgi:hypothetical protein